MFLFEESVNELNVKASHTHTFRIGALAFHLLASQNCSRGLVTLTTDGATKIVLDISFVRLDLTTGHLATIVRKDDRQCEKIAYHIFFIAPQPLQIFVPQS